MIIATFRIKKAGAPAASGSLKFGELRALLRAGLIDAGTELADDEYRFHPLGDYPELWAALFDPAIAEVEMAPLLKMNAGPEIVREKDVTTSRPVENPAGAELIDFAAVARGEVGFSAYDVLALNRSVEPDRVMRMPKWSEASRLVDLKRWLICSSPFLAIFAFSAWLLIKCMAEGQGGPGLIGVFMVFGFSFVVIGLMWGFFFLVDYHYPGKN